MTKAMPFTQAEVTGYVYVARIGKHIKIGFSRNVAKRLKTFETTSTDVELILAIPGDMRLEKLIHRLLSDLRIRNELFHQDCRITRFVRHVENENIATALHFLEESTPKRREQLKKDERDARTRAARVSKADKDAYFASLVADRDDPGGR